MAKAKRKSKPKTPTLTQQRKQEFNKQRKRINRAFSRLEARGYTIPESLKKIVYEPKRITPQKLERMRAFSTNDVYKNKSTTYTNPQTGEVLSGQQGRSFERKQTAKKSAETRKRNKQREENRLSKENAAQIQLSTFIAKLRKYANMGVESYNDVADELEAALQNRSYSDVWASVADLAAQLPGPATAHSQIERIEIYCDQFTHALKKAGLMNQKDVLEHYQRLDERDNEDYNKR